ncbi:MAG: YbhB/YbcL family Raf kinase inhibitor-like protein [Candidatus Nanohaloarchaea archaeon]|nr:YbhB/YbcL family Raf kinase inhibitor-like protein [Candidatus Nanohaloarchaea archaeon]
MESRPYLLFTALLLLAGCTGQSGTVTAPGDVDGSSTGNLTFSSPAFSAGNSIPARFTCDGQDQRPPFQIDGVPDPATTLAIVIDDPEAPSGTFTHWTAWNIPANRSHIPKDSLPEPTMQGMNGFGSTGYRGPCPPGGSNHTYRFTLYALNRQLRLEPGATKAQLFNAMDGHVVAKKRFTAYYSR